MIRAVYVGKVLDNDDPTGRGGLKVQVDELEDGTALRGGEYIPPTFPFAGADVGFFFLPENGALVEVEVESDPERATEELSPRWRAVLYTDRDKIPSEFRSDQTNRGGIKYGDGVLLFDQGTDLLALISTSVRLGTESASHPLMRGDTFNSEISTLFGLWKTTTTALKTIQGEWKTAAQGPSPWTPVTGTQQTFETALNALDAGIAAFLLKLLTWLSTRVKTE